MLENDDLIGRMYISLQLLILEKIGSMGTQGVLWDSLKFLMGLNKLFIFRKHLVLYKEPV